MIQAPHPTRIARAPRSARAEQSSENRRMDLLEALAVPPAGGADPALAIAACRAGAVGVLDLEFTAGGADALARLGRFTSSPYGVKLGRDSEALLERLA